MLIAGMSRMLKRVARQRASVGMAQLVTAAFPMVMNSLNNMAYDGGWGGITTGCTAPGLPEAP